MSAPPAIEDRNKIAVVVSQLLGVFLVIITLLTQHGEPLHSWRPTGTKNQTVASDDQNRDKFARLWDDPLEGLLTFQAGASLISPSPIPTSSLSPSPSASPTPTPLSSPAGETPRSPTAAPEPSPTLTAVAQAQIVVPAAQNQGNPAPLPSISSTPTSASTQTPPQSGTVNQSSDARRVSVSYTFLWNIIDARPLPETTEGRLRTRYALVAAILAEGYLPLRESVLKPLFKPGSESSPVKEQIGRFETFRKARGEGTNAWQYVSVIWTPKQLESIQLPIDSYTLNQIEAQICQEDIRDPVGTAITVDKIWFLHHGNSDDLSNLSAASASPPLNTSFVRATVPLKSDLKAWTPLQKITTDDVLVRSLVSELSSRIPSLNDPSKTPRVVVFTESDTTYSQAITAELRKRLEEKNVKLEIYSYLRALDGREDEPRLPESGDHPKSQEPASLLQGRAISETSFGTSQFDYLHRTALELKATSNGEQDVVAVGVLGSYIYDKMLVLQAARPVLPAAVFFTTDLDALYLERTKEPFTRNLVVASADDIEVNESDGDRTEGRRLPLMRDSYQTVLVKEVRNILRGQDRQTGSSATPTPTASPVARIFEIGPGQRVDLTGDLPNFWPLWWLAQWWISLLVFVLALGNAFIILGAVMTRDRANSPPGAMKKWASRWIWAEMILAGVFVLVLLWTLVFVKSDLLLGEALSLGISIWPSVMIRSLAFLVAIGLLSLASKSFVLYALPEKDNLTAVLGDKIQFEYRARNGRKVSSNFGDFFEALFGRKVLWWSIVIISIIYVFFSSVVFMIWQPTVPGRGGSALLIEKVVLAFGVALYIVHLIFCLDLHFSAYRLLRVVGSHFDPVCPTGSPSSIDFEQMLTSLGTLTTVIGKTLLYPLTVLILIILSRLTIFDNWVMTPSLIITFLFGAIVLVAASLLLWMEGSKLKRDVLAQTSLWPAEQSSVQAVNNGVFAAWYRQPIVSALYSVLAVFGSLSLAALIRLFSESY
jgi:hypothetical protein